MNVTPSGTYPQPVRSKAETTTRGVGPTPGGSAPAEAAGAESASFLPTGDLTKLLAAVRQSPDVRPDAINSVAARLAAGQFDTPEAAADAARGLLASGD